MNIDMDAVVSGATDAILWTSSCSGTVSIDGHAHTTDAPEDCDKSLSLIGYTADDMADQAREQIAADVRAFVETNADDLAALIGEGKADAGSIGYDFTLTRNREGAGFWDRGYGERGERLTANTHPYGEMSGYVGDDGRVYV